MVHMTLKYARKHQSYGIFSLFILSFLLIIASGCQYSYKAPLSSLSIDNLSIPRQVWLLGGDSLSKDQRVSFQNSKHLLIMIPGISSGDIEITCQFLDHVRSRAGEEIAIFYNWGGLDITRKIASSTSTASAASHLVSLCQKFLDDGENNRTIDILAHSAGSIVVNKAAIQISESNSAIRFRHVLFLGTPHDPEVNLDALKSISAGILNIYSDYDKINRNISGNSGLLANLEGEEYRNLRMDTSLGGRQIRHYAYLKDNPENWVQYGDYLRNGEWPQPKPLPVEPAAGSPEILHRFALWIKDKSAGDYSITAIDKMIMQSLANPDPQVKYYGALIAGMVKAREFVPRLKDILKNNNSPVYLRAEIYQTLGNFEDGRQIRFLQQARKEDEECAEEIRDVLRELKLKRIKPVREPRRTRAER